MSAVTNTTSERNRRVRTSLRAWMVFIGLVCTALVFSLVSRDAQAFSPEVTFIGSVESGGALSLTMNPELTEITRVELIQVRLSTKYCGAIGVSLTGYFDPPLRVVGGEFSFSVARPDTPNSTVPYWVNGNIDDSGQISGTVQTGGGLACQPGPPERWSVSGPASEPPGSSDLTFANDAGTVVLTTNPARELVTSLTLDDIDLSPCIESASVRTFFKPAAPFHPERGRPATRFLHLAEDQQTNAVLFEVTTTNSESLHLTVSAGTIACSSEKSWLLHPATDADSGIVAVEPRQLPATGSGGRAGSSDTAIFVTIFSIIVLLLGAATVCAVYREKAIPRSEIPED